MPKISEKDLDTIVHAVRKTAHVTEYAILAMLLFRAFARSSRQVHGVAQAHTGSGVATSKFPCRAAVLAWIFSALYAVTDEFHQTFIPSREGQVTDVLIDSLGAVLGIFAAWFIGRWLKRWQALRWRVGASSRRH